ncbi:MAG: hypothetical protein Q8L86_08575 [Vicinamibacterales bacterium]|nr:hypothetical protein [Vicinamibacterales bacterium]
MNRTTGLMATAALVLLVGAASMSGQGQAQPPQQPMSFFVTSTGPGNGGNLGGLAGADAHCQTLAAAAGAGNRTWRAYLSQGAAGSAPVINARDRIGSGPWYNARGVLIASNVEDLHEDRNNIRKPTALDEKGAEVLGVGDKPNQHDILTGSDSQGRVVPGNVLVTTCNNWTSADPAHRAMVGHHDRLGGASASWNAVHSSGGCSQENLVATGGAGLLYCFAVN